METARPVATIFIERHTDRLRTRRLVNRALARAGAIRANVSTVSPNDATPFAPRTLIVDPFVKHAQREALDDIGLCALDFIPCPLIASFVTLQPRESTALETSRQANHLRKQQRCLANRRGLRLLARLDPNQQPTEIVRKCECAQSNFRIGNRVGELTTNAHCNACPLHQINHGSLLFVLTSQCPKGKGLQVCAPATCATCALTSRMSRPRTRARGRALGRRDMGRPRRAKAGAAARRPYRHGAPTRYSGLSSSPAVTSSRSTSGSCSSRT